MTRLARLATASFTLLAIPACFSSDDAPTTQSTHVFQHGDPASIRLAGQLTMQHLARIEPDIVDSLEVHKIEIDNRGHAYARLNQTIAGFPVFGAQAIVKLTPNGEYVGKLDKLARDLRVDTVATIDAAQAEALAMQSRGLVAPRAVTAKSDLQILTGHGKERLAHRVQLDYLDGDKPQRPVVFIDAKTGAVLWSYDNLQTAKNRELHNLNHGTSLPGPIARVEGGAATGDNDVDTNYALLGWTYDCYQNLYGRDSFDNAGAKLISSVHYSNNYVNAFWNGTQMVYGDGDNVYSISLAISMDVTAHELTHAVTEYTSNLIYSGESGGLNESMSDIFGNVCEWYRDNNGNVAGPTNPNNYLVGDEIWLPEPALRYMADPVLDGASLDYWTSSAGNVDVHYSSGISNLAFYLLAEGGTHPRGKSPQVVTGIGIHDAAAIFYRANATYLMPSSNFADARAATAQAAADLFGASSAQVTQTHNAWTAVGVMEPPDYDVIDTKTNLASSSGNLNYSYATNGATAMKFTISGGTGDADLYVRFGAPPTTSQWDCRPYSSGNNETCEFNPAQSGTYYVMLVPFTPFSGVTLTVSAAGSGEPTTETSCTGKTVPGQTAWQQYPGWPNALYLDVDTSTCGYTATPRYFTSLGGITNHWRTTGATSIYSPTATGFRVYVFDTHGPVTPTEANARQWHIEWQALPGDQRRPEVCTGGTPESATAWQQYPGWPNALYLDVDTSACGYTATPRYLTSFGGITNHWRTTGATSVYSPTATGFRVYVFDSTGSVTPTEANARQWHINWQALPDNQRRPEVCTGGTPEGATAWQQYPGWPNALYLDVDTSACGYTGTLRYFTSFGGITNHWRTTGATSIYSPTATGFRVYVFDEHGSVTPVEANARRWHINWQVRPE